MNLNFSGVVIREEPKSETGKLLYVLTENDGIVIISARGARKISASYLKSAQLFAYSTFTVYQKNNYNTLTEAQLIENFYNIRNDIFSFSFASYVCELAQNMAVPGDGAILRLVLNTLFAISKNVAPLKIIKAVFEFKLCCMNGYFLKIKQGDYFNFDQSEFCDAPIGNNCIKLNSAVKKTLTYISECELSKMLAFTADDTTIGLLCVFAEKYLLSLAEFTPKTLLFFKSL
ncbi:MAG: DNA repair protein RecO [Clostridia bacterium]